MSVFGNALVQISGTSSRAFQQLRNVTIRHYVETMMVSTPCSETFATRRTQTLGDGLITEPPAPAIRVLGPCYGA